jgi:hypothetical protein
MFVGESTEAAKHRHPSDESEQGVACSLWMLLPRNSLGLFGY